MIPSNRQEAVYNCWQEEDKNMVIQSVAGSGKTTTLMGLLERSQWRTLFLAFNKSIQTEIEQNINSKGMKHAKALTLHSLGLSAIRTYYRPVINNNKKWDIINKFKEFHKSDLRKMNYKEQMHLLFTLMDMLDVYRIYFSKTFTQLITDMASMGKPIDAESSERLEYYWNHIKEIYIDFTFKEEGKKIDIDFLDMIFIPVYKNEITIPVKPYYLFIDECQDLNLVQHKFINKLLAQGDINKWVAVGDKRQSIYGFSGSFSQSFNMFLNRDNVLSFPLDVCYRSAKNIIQEANKVYDVMQPYQELEGIVDIVKNSAEIKDGSMVVCRNTAPIISLYFELLSQERKVYIKGEDILGPTIKFLRPYVRTSISKVIGETIKEISKVSEKKTDSERIKFYVLSNNLENLRILNANLNLPDKKISTLVDKLKELSKKSQEPGSIELCTIHKSKGRENDVVYILEENLIPSPFAITPDQIEQEINLKYVARTRAKKELYYLNLKNND